MPKVIKQSKFIFSDIKENNNKFWNVELLDDGTVTTKYGRVGYDAQESSWPGVGQSFFDKKIKEKTKKGYTELRTLENQGGKTVRASASSQGQLQQIAINQMAKNNPELSKMVKRLVESNIHTITTSTNISYNSATGLFSTPLGIVTLDAINEARDLLVEIKKTLKAGDTGGMGYFINNYLRLVPQNIGMKRVKALDIFPDNEAIKKQANILDSLESSFNTATKSPTKPDQKDEQLFKVEMTILEDDKERARIERHYQDTKKSMHGYDNIKIKQIYKVMVAEMDEAFKDAKPSNLQEVYHGTSQANLLSILKSGIKVSPPSTAYIAGKMFGNGIYGAIQSSKSLGYTYGKWGGSTGDSGWLFICDFNMGKIHEPSRTCSGPPSGFDSIWAKATKVGLAHDELIVYKNHQVNIKFLLECK